MKKDKKGMGFGVMLELGMPKMKKGKKMEEDMEELEDEEMEEEEVYEDEEMMLEDEEDVMEEDMDIESSLVQEIFDAVNENDIEMFKSSLSDLVALIVDKSK